MPADVFRFLHHGDGPRPRLLDGPEVLLSPGVASRTRATPKRRPGHSRVAYERVTASGTILSRCGRRQTAMYTPTIKSPPRAFLGPICDAFPIAWNRFVDMARSRVRARIQVLGRRVAETEGNTTGILRNFLPYMDEKKQRELFAWGWCFEHQKNGSPHGHALMLCKVPGDDKWIFSKSEIHTIWQEHFASALKSVSLEAWTWFTSHGKAANCHVETVRKDCVRYVTKYLTKDISLHFAPEPMKQYWGCTDEVRSISREESWVFEFSWSTKSPQVIAEELAGCGLTSWPERVVTEDGNSWASVMFTHADSRGLVASYVLKLFDRSDSRYRKPPPIGEPTEEYYLTPASAPWKT